MSSPTPTGSVYVAATVLPAGFVAWIDLPGATEQYHPTCPLRAFNQACEWALVRLGLREPWVIGGEP